MPEVTIDETELTTLRDRAAAADSAAAAAQTAGADADAARAALTVGVERFRATLAEAHHLQPDHLPGATFDEVEASARRAADIVAAAAAATRPATPAAATVPAGGANTRDAPPPTDGMSPIQKVAFGLEQRGRKL
jgi:hypothetical protein